MQGITEDIVWLKGLSMPTKSHVISYSFLIFIKLKQYVTLHRLSKGQHYPIPDGINPDLIFVVTGCVILTLITLNNNNQPIIAITLTPRSSFETLKLKEYQNYKVNSVVAQTDSEILTLANHEFITFAQKNRTSDSFVTLLQTLIP